MSARRIVSPRSTWGLVAVACAAALAAAGGLAANGLDHGPAFGAGLGASAAVLAVLALPSLPTRTTASLVLALGGVVVVRHVSRPGTGLTLVALWAVFTLLALVLIDRADLDERPRLAAGSPLPALARETATAMGVLAVAVLFVASLLVPVLGHRPSDQLGAGAVPRFDLGGAPGSSLVQNDVLDTTIRPHLGNEIVMTVSASRPEFWRGETYDVWNGHTWTRSDDRRFTVPNVGDTTFLPPQPLQGTPLAGSRRLTTSDLVVASVRSVSVLSCA